MACIISIKSGTGGESRRIELSDGSFFSFKSCYLPEVFIDESLYTPGACEGREISGEESDAFRFASACMRTEAIALRLISRAEQTCAGLSRKLEKRGHEAACVRQVVRRLADLELLDDRRYARLWLASRLSCRTDSPRRLLAALRARGIARDDAESGLKAALDSETELKLLLRYVQKSEKRKRLRKIAGAADPVRSLKFMLKGEGFSSGAIQEMCELEAGKAACAEGEP